MHSASERSEQEIAEALAIEAVNDALRTLTATIMRVAAGAGEPYHLAQHASEFVAAYVAYRDVAKVYPSSFQLQGMLVPERDTNLEERLKDEELHEFHAVQKIEIGVLRAFAARLVGPHVQKVRASHLMYEGINAILHLRRERDAKRDKARRTAIVAPKPKTSPQKRLKRKAVEPDL